MMTQASEPGPGSCRDPAAASPHLPAGRTPDPRHAQTVHLAPGELESRLRQRGAGVRGATVGALAQGRQAAPSPREPGRAPELAPGSRLDQRYLLQEVVGQGGFARVFRAQDERTGATVALKVLLATRTLEGQIHQARFAREARVLAQLRCPWTTRIMDVGHTAQGVRWMAMEFLEGEPLDRMLQRSGPRSAAWCLRMARQVLASLHEAHGLGIVHRDIKPGNLFVVHEDGDEPLVRVLDFGIARAPTLDQALTWDGEVPCTPAYVAPEVVAGEPASAASDLYALGLVMLEVLTGRRVVEGRTALEICGRQLNLHEAVPMPPTLAESAFGRVLARAVAKPLHQRWDSAASMLEALQDPAVMASAEALGLTVPSALPAGSARSGPRGWVLRVAVIALGVLGLLWAASFFIGNL
jgi:serine/threonine-protein kinase